MKTANLPELTNKSLEDLYVLADNISALKYEESIKQYLFGNSNQYESTAFNTLFCGRPKIYASLNLPVVLERNFPNPYRGILFYGCTYVVHCRALENILDLDGRQIYEGSNGTLFVYRYTAPSAVQLIDDALFAPPRIEFAESVAQNAVYGKAAEMVVQQLDGKLKDGDDEYLKLYLTNRIAELQMQAYIQGRGYKDGNYYDAALPPVEDTNEET